MARGFFGKTERIAWAMVTVAALMVGLFLVLHMASGLPVVGGAANTAGSYVSGQAFGY